jgi:hypothetical protein
MRPLKIRSLAALAAAFFACSQLYAGSLVLSSKFVEKIKNQATMTIQLEVDEHLTTPHRVNKGGDDGDVHMAGRSQGVKLPLVAEIINARLEKKSMQLLNQSSSSGTIAVTGVWRLWFEHPSPGQMIQGDTVDKPGDSNPDHVFEIHPITRFGDNTILDSFVPITSSKGKAYDAYAASVAFPKYEALNSTIENNGSAITITSGKAGYNYAEFVIELAAKPNAVSDGFFVLARVFDTDDEEEPVISDARRMVFIKGTDPANQVQTLKKGDRLHVLGIPRVNLAEVAAVQPGEPVEMNLPYEMIIIAILPD